MPLNLLINYNRLLEITAFNEPQRNQSLRGVFNRDIANNQNFAFQGKNINPTSSDGQDSMDRLFTHLTTIIVDKKTNEREFDATRSVRLHWLKHHIEERKTENMFVFSVEEPDGIRTYIYDEDEHYVIILEPMRKKDEYYLLSAYYLEGRDKARNKMMRKYARRMDNVA